MEGGQGASFDGRMSCHAILMVMSLKVMPGRHHGNKVFVCDLRDSLWPRFIFPHHLLCTKQHKKVCDKACEIAHEILALNAVQNVFVMILGNIIWRSLTACICSNKITLCLLKGILNLHCLSLESRFSSKYTKRPQKLGSRLDPYILMP